jgi:hypothetical protein
MLFCRDNYWLNAPILVHFHLPQKFAGNDYTQKLQLGRSEPIALSDDKDRDILGLNQSSEIFVVAQAEPRLKLLGFWLRMITCLLRRVFVIESLYFLSKIRICYRFLINAMLLSYWNLTTLALMSAWLQRTRDRSCSVEYSIRTDNESSVRGLCGKSG